jgi:hypothetical protein
LVLCCASFCGFLSSSLSLAHKYKGTDQVPQAKRRPTGTSAEPQIFEKDFRRATNHKFVGGAWKSLLTTGDTAEEVFTKASICLSVYPSGASENGLTCMPILGYFLALTYHTRLYRTQFKYFHHAVYQVQDVFACTVPDYLIARCTGIWRPKTWSVPRNQPSRPPLSCCPLE